MNKLKFAALVAVGVLVLGGSAYAATPPGFWDVVATKVATILAGKVSAPAKADPAKGQNLGAVTSPLLPNLICQGQLCSTVVRQTFQAGTTTIVSFPSPFLQATSTGAGAEVVVKTDDSGNKFTSATTSIDYVRLDITGGATSSFRLACGATSTPSYGGATTGALYNGTAIVSTTPALAGDSIATSSIGVIENNVSAVQGNLVGVGSVAKITTNSAAPYFTCVVDAVSATAFTNAQSSFAGKITVRFNKPQ